MSSKKPGKQTDSSKKKTKYLEPSDKLTLISGDKLIKLDHKPTRHYWGNHVTDGMLGMLYGPRGSGKTFAALGIAISIATGKKFLGHGPEKPRNVLLLDGEMGTKLLKQRTQEMRKSLGADNLKNLSIFSPDMYRHVLPTLAGKEGQTAIDGLISKNVNVVIVDNISAWNHGGREDADGWSAWAEWMLKHKHLGRTVILIHHANKGGGQRGTSRKEDNLDFVIQLSPFSNPKHPTALSFNLTWEKVRSEGKESTPVLQVTRVERDKKPPKWEHLEVAGLEGRIAEAVELSEKGMAPKQIAEAMGVTKSSVSRYLKAGK